MSFFKKFTEDLSKDLDRLIGSDKKKEEKVPTPPPGQYLPLPPVKLRGVYNSC